MCYLLHGNTHAKFCIFHAKGLFMSKIQCWCRANAMLVISLLAAVVTAFFVPPDRDYLGYYDLKTLACLFCVLAVVGALRDLHIFSALSQRMVHTFSTVRGVCTALVVITMFGSMLLTNDTALLTFFATGLVCSFLHWTGKAHGAPVHSAKLCRQPLRNDHALRQSAESLSFQLLRSFYENVLFGNAAAIHPVYCSHSPVLLSVSKRTAFRAGSTGHGRLMPSRYLWWTILFSRCHGAAAGTLCPWFDGHCSGALVSGPACAENCRLGIVGHLRRFFHLFRQPCSNGSCPHTVRSPFVPRDHAGLRAYLPDHQQCSCCYSAQPLHAGCLRASGWRQCGRRRNAGGFSGKPHYLSGIYSPCS